MAKSVVSIFWKDHSSELATVYSSLLENNYLVDCTLSAEGQSIKAHRLVLCACSPYFNYNFHDMREIIPGGSDIKKFHQELMLFHEETEDHPHIIIIDESFETLKAVIDFVYRGEIQISEGDLKAFMTLAQSLQIKGLNDFLKDYKNKNLYSSRIENDTRGPFRGNQDTCEVESFSVNPDYNSEIYSQQALHLLDGHPDTMHTKTSVLLEGYDATCEEVQCPQEYQKAQGCEKAEMTVKCESLFEGFVGTRNMVLDNIKSEKSVFGNFMCEINEGTSVFGCSDSHGNVELSVVPSQQHQPKQLSEVSLDRNVAEKDELLLPTILVPKSKLMDYQGSEESMDDPDEQGNDTKETFEGTVAVQDGQNSDQCSRAVGHPSEDEATRAAAGGGQRRRRPQGAKTSASPSGRQVHVSRQARKTLLSCGECPASFTSVNGLKYHMRTHTGERPFSCEVCGNAFSKKSTLASHKRTHTGERPYTCDVCGKGFSMKSNLVTHMHTHTGERPYACDVCGKSFSNKSNLVSHMNTHTGERPYSCDMCGNTFANAHHLIYHIRTHTGERPYRCDICSKAFTQKSNLATHLRTHTGERPYRCDTCGCTFIHPSSLAKHKRTHI
ncbi:Zinc finger protein squeeze [Gryllus bimaculatus]|nr:Zinc finger protein squeeze [Gryllus bimaculatus]